jgi:hypothetical protein
MTTRRTWPSVAMIVLVLATAVPAMGQVGRSGPSPLALGDPAADLVYSPVPPCRILDTRGAGGPILAGTQRSFVVAGATGFEAQGGTSGGCAISEGAATVLVNLVAVGPAGPGNLRAWPAGQPVPLASVINYAALPGLNIANGLALPLCAAPDPCPFDLTVQADASATDLVADVLGFFQPVAAGGISTALIADAAVTGPKLAPGSVDSSRILDGSIGAADVNLAEIQKRVTGACDPGSAIRIVNSDGSVSCQADTSSGGTVTSVAAGDGLLAFPSPITTSGALSVLFGGSGFAPVAARADHDHDGAYWKLGGNAGTIAGFHFVGTTDAVALEMKVNAQRALRLEPGGTDPQFGVSPNVIGGHSANSVTAGVVGAVVGGGGSAVAACGSGLTDPCLNRVTDSFGTVGGGANNQASRFATLGGGIDNAASGGVATVGGGIQNTASGGEATVGGGSVNTASGAAAAVGGGNTNTASSDFATVGGGKSNTASGIYATVGGGTLNTASGRIAATVGGGEGNTASGFDAATVGGGGANTASSDAATVGGGIFNRAEGFAATVGGGDTNTASLGAATVGGGGLNTASGLAATVPGGQLDVAAGAFSLAAGRRAKTRDAGTLAAHDGAFVFADSSDFDFNSTAANQFAVRATGGARLVLAIDSTGAATWTCSVVNGGS